MLEDSTEYKNSKYLIINQLRNNMESSIKNSYQDKLFIYYSIITH